MVISSNTRGIISIIKAHGTICDGQYTAQLLFLGKSKTGLLKFNLRIPETCNCGCGECNRRSVAQIIQFPYIKAKLYVVLRENSYNSS